MEEVSKDEQNLVKYFEKLKSITNMKDLNIVIGEIEFILDKPKLGMELCFKYFPFLSEGINSKVQEIQILCIGQLTKMFQHLGSLDQKSFLEKIDFLEEKGVWRRLFDLLEKSEEEKVPSHIVKCVVSMCKADKDYVKYLYDPKEDYKGRKKPGKTWSEMLAQVLKAERIEVKMRGVELKLELRKELKQFINIDQEIKELMNIWESDDLLAKMGVIDVLQNTIQVLKNESSFIDYLKSTGMMESCLQVVVKELKGEEEFMFTPQLFRIIRTVGEDSQIGAKFLLESEKMKFLLNECLLSEPITLKSQLRENIVSHVLGFLQVSSHFEDTFQFFQNHIKWIWFNICASLTVGEELRIAAFHCLASIIASCFQRKVPNSSSFFKELLNNISCEWTTFLIGEAKDLKTNTLLKCSIYAFMQACSLYDWGVTELFSNHSFFDFITEKQTEEKAGKEAKYEVLYTIFKNPHTLRVVDEEKFRLIDEHLRKGPLVDTQKKDKVHIKTEAN